MNDAVKVRVIETLSELLDRMVVCNSRNCYVCQNVKKQVELLATDLGIDAEAIMPHRLKERRD